MQERAKSIGRWFADLPGGRRTKFAIVGVWLVVLVAIGPLAGKFEDVQENDPADYLPAEGGVGRRRSRCSRTSPRVTSPTRSPSSTATAASSRRDEAAIEEIRGDDQRRAPRGRRRDRPADPLRGRQLGAADHADHGRGRHQRGRRAARRRHRRHQGRPRGPARGARGEGDRAGRLLGRRDRRLRLDQRRPALRDRAARPRPADHHLPQPDLLADPVLLGDPRRGHLARHGLPARRGRASP